MRTELIKGLFLFLVLPALLGAQSLSELAKEEKKRREKNKESGKQVTVITDKELAENKGTIANRDAATAASQPAGERTSPPRRTYNVREEEEDSEVTDVPTDASLENKLAAFASMKDSYLEKVKSIDEEIEKNNERISEIQEELVSTGGTGLPTAPRADMTPRNPGDIPGLRNEQQELRNKNQVLEAQKKTLKDELVQKGRRAGIPASYLRF